MLRLSRQSLALLLSTFVAVGALAGCGSATTPSTPTTATTTTTQVTTNAPTTTQTTQDAAGCPTGTTIPQGGGDNDSDNSGGASDGDGCL